MYDLFISHASEDKDTVVHELAKKLVELGLKVWYDEFTLTIGDSIRRKIEEGLSNSRYGVVILSPNFFAKEWPKKELDALTSRESTGENVILPVWHGLSCEDVLKYSPLLADKYASSTKRGIPAVAAEIYNKCKHEPNIKDIVNSDSTSIDYLDDMRHNGIWHHMDKIDALGSTYAAIASEAGNLNYNYEFIVYFLKLKNSNYGWFVEEYKHEYKPVKIPSIEDYLQILCFRASQFKKVFDTKNLKLDWEWPKSWGHVAWAGPIIHLPENKDIKHYYALVKIQYRLTVIAIEHYKILYNIEAHNNCFHTDSTAASFFDFWNA